MHAWVTFPMLKNYLIDFTKMNSYIRENKKVYHFIKKNKKQAGAELGQAQLKLGLNCN